MTNEELIEEFKRHMDTMPMHPDGQGAHNRGKLACVTAFKAGVDVVTISEGNIDGAVAEAVQTLVHAFVKGIEQSLALKAQQPDVDALDAEEIG